MMKADKLVAINGGFMVLVGAKKEDFPSREDLEGMVSKSLVIRQETNGITIIAGPIEAYVPEDVIDYVTNNPILHIMAAGDYTARPILVVQLERDELVEARGIYNYRKTLAAKPR